MGLPSTWRTLGRYSLTSYSSLTSTRFRPLVTVLIGLPAAPTGKWSFSTNGIYWAGKARIAAIGFGPGDEVTAHTVNDSVSLDEVVKATEFYAILPSLLKK